MSHRSNRTVALTTLGCKVNQADSDEWLRQFVGRGYEVVDFESTADAYIVNTCTVTHIADRKSRHLLRQARRQNPAAIVVAAGCYASVSPNELAAMSEVDLVVGDRDKPRLVELVHERLEGETEQPFEAVGGATRIFGPRHRGFVKIGDGCDKFCTFCIVPYARGRARSADPATVLAKVRGLVDAGFREIVLTAVHMGSYGQDLTPRTTLRDLVERVLTETRVTRLRLSSIEPEDFDDGLLHVFSADQRLCRHIHLALDSGCDATLARMRRRYSAAQYEALVARIRGAIPDVAMTTDVMVGFPGESDGDFETSRTFVERQDFAAIHVFPYSIRRGTAASKFSNQVSPEIKKSRTDAMLLLADESAARFRTRFIGQVMPVLYESERRDEAGPYWDGLTDNYVRVRVHVEAELTNALLPTLLVRDGAGLVHGELVELVLAHPATRPARVPIPLLNLSSASR